LGSMENELCHLGLCIHAGPNYLVYKQGEICPRPEVTHKLLRGNHTPLTNKPPPMTPEDSCFCS
jgi:hypothetical protein